MVQFGIMIQCEINQIISGGVLLSARMVLLNGWSQLGYRVKNVQQKILLGVRTAVGGSSVALSCQLEIGENTY